MEFGMAGFVFDDAVVTFATTISAIDRNSIQQGDWNDECPQSCHYISLGKTHGARLLSIYNVSHGTEKGDLPPCLRPKLDVTPKLERYSCFWH
mmetsp:Transcript_6677/g.12220  ORF Transcript_6677/g.12220 Transcript_6677/m.12220 type:complete len:93 (+) Transcript_6677:395-673(+)